MANHDDLDSFFKKKDRKGKKHPTLVTNNEELLKKLAIVTSATTAFKENMDFDDDDDYEARRGITDENHREPVDENQHPPNPKAKLASNPKQPQQQPVTHIHFPSGENASTNAQDEWEDFVDTQERYNQLRMKLNPNLADDDQSNEDEDADELNNGHDEHHNHENHPNASKDKPVWKFQPTQSAVGEKPVETPVEMKEETPVVKPAAVYRPPQMRSHAGQTGAVTIVSGVQQRTNKKEKPNIASTEDFPTLGKTVNKK